mmetsp:Transcript_16220/g.34251  ORF Transcript_16220/g.34251 Transcript_16220/m.34251 type:complete len:418 (+) Transcript_16220:139-1392(+)
MAIYIYRHSIRSFLLFLIKVNISSTFPLRFGVVPKCLCLTRTLSSPRRRVLFVSSEGENGSIDTQNVYNRDQSKSRQQKQRQRRRRRSHNESHITAAGAEQLFSISWWSFFSKSSVTTIEKDANAYILADRADLPPIDCEWACHSDEEIIQLQQMKLLLAADMQPIVNRELDKTYPDVYSDLRILRFLRKDKERNVVSSSERYKSFLKWREENNVDKIRAAVESEWGGSSFVPPDQNMRRVAEYCPMKFDYMFGSAPGSGVSGSNKDSDAVQPAIIYVGSFDTYGISEQIKSPESSMSLDDFINFWIFIYESIHVHLYQQSMSLGKMVFLDVVCDLSGLSLQQFAPYFVTKVMKPWLRMTQSNYPETTRRIYILKPPSIINFAWNLVTPLLSQGTVDKIRFEKKFKGSADDFCGTRK